MDYGKDQVCIPNPTTQLSWTTIWHYGQKQLLKGMPPIELFFDLDAMHTLTAAVPRLPTWEQLKEWLFKHNKIKKETELFNSGKLKKFKNITMGQSQAHILLPFTKVELPMQLPWSVIYPLKIWISLS